MPTTGPEEETYAPQAEKSLDNLFDDDDDDDDEDDVDGDADMMLIDTNDITKAAANDMQATVDYSDPTVMLVFYQRLFPFRYLFEWLNHSPNPGKAFTNREFAFTLQNDVYLRYLSFTTHSALKAQVIATNPKRFEIGPVYSANPRDRKALQKKAFKPLEKELVFDIDLTDYDDIRTCCTKANICNKCWGFITVAIRILDIALKEDFGFKHVLWVYSGRRGAHAWISDARGRKYDDHIRKSLASYLEVIKGGAQGGKRVNVSRPLHPHLQRSLDICKRDFGRMILEEQDPWREQKGYERLLQLLPDKGGPLDGNVFLIADLTIALRKRWESHDGRSSLQKWADIDTLAESGVSKTLNTKLLVQAKQDIVLEYMYPRLDIEVSKHLNHLLKSPFCVHPGTGRICVPIDSADPEAFDPLTVPTVTSLLGEIDSWENGPDANSSERISDWEKTSLKDYIRYFKKYVDRIMADERGVKREREEEMGGMAISGKVLDF